MLGADAGEGGEASESSRPRVVAAQEWRMAADSWAERAAARAAGRAAAAVRRDSADGFASRVSREDGSRYGTRTVIPSLCRGDKRTWSSTRAARLTTGTARSSHDAAPGPGDVASMARTGCALGGGDAGEPCSPEEWSPNGIASNAGRWEETRGESCKTLCPVRQ